MILVHCKVASSWKLSNVRLHLDGEDAGEQTDGGLEVVGGVRQLLLRQLKSFTFVKERSQNVDKV